MKTYRIDLVGCDDTTTIIADLTESDFNTIEALSLQSQETSTSQCEPVMRIAEATPKDIERYGQEPTE